MRSIQAAVVRQRGGPFVIEPITLDDPRDNEVLIWIAGVGLCHTDPVVRDQYFPTPLPAVLGHEGAGTVEKVGARVTLVAAGFGVTLVPQSIQQIRAKGIVYLPIEGKGPSSPISLAYRRNDRSAAVRNFIALARPKSP
jgi:NADPH:quinone reductase-like Zn-dependent oxidoreductase